MYLDPILFSKTFWYDYISSIRKNAILTWGAYILNGGGFGPFFRFMYGQLANSWKYFLSFWHIWWINMRDTCILSQILGSYLDRIKTSFFGLCFGNL